MRGTRGHRHWHRVAVRGRCRSRGRRHLPGGSAGREGEDTSTGLKWQCVDGAGVGGTRLAAVFEGNERAPALAFKSSAWMVRE